MTSIKCIFIWFGGVLTEGFTDCVISVLERYKNIQVGHLNYRRSILTAADYLRLGLIDISSYCYRLSQELEVDINEVELWERIKRILTVSPKLLNVVYELKDRYDLWLISDYPSEWHNSIVEQLDINSLFSSNRTIICSECGLTKLIPDLFFFAINKSHYPIENCMLVDKDSKRAVEAIRVGLSATIFIDVPRFRREFVLRKMLPSSSVDYRVKNVIRNNLL